MNEDLYRMTAEQRYYRDPEFHALVDLLTKFILDHKFSPSELREAAALAAIKYEYSRRSP